MGFGGQFLERPTIDGQQAGLALLLRRLARPRLLVVPEIRVAACRPGSGV